MSLKSWIEKEDQTANRASISSENQTLGGYQFTSEEAIINDEWKLRRAKLEIENTNKNKNLTRISILFK